MKKRVGTIDVTPKWQGVLNMLIVGIESGGKAKRIAIEELQRMAEAADNWNEHCTDARDLDTPEG